MPRVDLKNPENWIPREIFSKYIGPNSAGMLAYYDKARQKKNAMTASFNLLAILMLPAWLGLRQQWTLLATYTGIVGILPFIEYLTGIVIPNGAFVAINVMMGTMVNGLLLSNATAIYLKMRNQGLNDEVIGQRLCNKAKRQIPMAIVGLIGSAGIVVGLAVLADCVFAQPSP